MAKGKNDVPTASTAVEFTQMNARKWTEKEKYECFSDRHKHSDNLSRDIFATMKKESNDLK
jgi:hypothetical protein